MTISMLTDPKGPFVPPGHNRLFGVYPALVTAVVDRDTKHGRVRLRYPWLDATNSVEPWARVATLMAGPKRGTWFIPEVEDEVLVSFVSGDPRWPVVIGCLWNGVDEPPEEMDGAGDNDVRSITSKAGLTLSFNDKNGEERIEIETPGGEKIRVDQGNGGKITLEHRKGSRIVIDQDGTVTIAAAQKRVIVDAAEAAEIDAPLVEVNAPHSTFSALVSCKTLAVDASIRCDTLIAKKIKTDEIDSVKYAERGVDGHLV
jgi:uncharacterized protein involved in type VI secretion and phage assembly